MAEEFAKKFSLHLITTLLPPENSHKFFVFVSFVYVGVLGRVSGRTNKQNKVSL